MRFTLRTWFIFITLLCMTLANLEFGYRPGSYEMSTVLWVRSRYPNSFCIAYDRPTPGFRYYSEWQIETPWTSTFITHKWRVTTYSKEGKVYRFRYSNYTNLPIKVESLAP